MLQKSMRLLAAEDLSIDLIRPSLGPDEGGTAAQFPRLLLAFES
jgi:hypothetical protein